jgi:hypothetical protein
MSQSRNKKHPLKLRSQSRVISGPLNTVSSIAIQQPLFSLQQDKFQLCHCGAASRMLDVVCIGNRQ